MRLNKDDLLLYTVTDRRWLGDETLCRQVEQALKGGATFIQLREKQLKEEAFAEEAKSVKELCRRYGVPFVINDNVKIAESVGADGVHVGQQDMEAACVRSAIGNEKILGVSVQTVEQAKSAEAAGADYLGVGAVFSTGSKADAVEVTYEVAKEICEAVNIPVIAIGGINIRNITELSGLGVCGVAVISAILGAEDIEHSTRELKEAAEKMVKKKARIKGVIFDVDGTLLDTMNCWTDSGARYLNSLGITAEKDLGDKLFTMTVDMGADYLIENYGLYKSHDEVKNGINAGVEGFYFSEAQFKPGAKELLHRMKQAGIKMTVATSTDRYCVEGAFERLGAMEYFDEIFTCTEVGASKSKPDIFFRAMESMNTSPGETWLFEDGLYSIKTAKAEGLKIVGVYDEVSDSDWEEIKSCSDVYVKDLTEFNLI